MQQAIDLFAVMVEMAAPWAFTFAIGQLIFNMFFKMAFGGKVEIGL